MCELTLQTVSLGERFRLLMFRSGDCCWNSNSEIQRSLGMTPQCHSLQSSSEIVEPFWILNHPTLPACTVRRRGCTMFRLFVCLFFCWWAHRQCTPVDHMTALRQATASFNAVRQDDLNTTVFWKSNRVLVKKKNRSSSMRWCVQKECCSSHGSCKAPLCSYKASTERHVKEKWSRRFKNVSQNAEVSTAANWFKKKYTKYT